MIDNNKRQAQLKIVFNAFHSSPKTMKEVDIEVGVMRESICRYVATLRKENLIYPVEQRICKITKAPAWTWTTNPDMIPPSAQLKLWEL